jgi:hypothetical protein
MEDFHYQDVQCRCGSYAYYTPYAYSYGYAPYTYSYKETAPSASTPLGGKCLAGIGLSPRYRRPGKAISVSFTVGRQRRWELFPPSISPVLPPA